MIVFVQMQNIRVRISGVQDPDFGVQSDRIYFQKILELGFQISIVFHLVEKIQQKPFTSDCIKCPIS